jgi:hypothetical protein
VRDAVEVPLLCKRIWLDRMPGKRTAMRARSPWIPILLDVIRWWIGKIFSFFVSVSMALSTRLHIHWMDPSGEQCARWQMEFPVAMRLSTLRLVIQDLTGLPPARQLLSLWSPVDGLLARLPSFSSDEEPDPSLVQVLQM